MDDAGEEVEGEGGTGGGWMTRQRVDEDGRVD